MISNGQLSTTTVVKTTIQQNYTILSDKKHTRFVLNNHCKSVYVLCAFEFYTFKPSDSLQNKFDVISRRFCHLQDSSNACNSTHIFSYISNKNAWAKYANSLF